MSCRSIIDWSATASWVQAIGSIAAVAGAAGIAVWQSRRQHEIAVDALQIEQAANDARRLRENTTFVDAGQFVLNRAENVTQSILAKLEECAVENMIAFTGRHSIWVSAMRGIAADLRLLAGRAPSGMLAAEFVRCAAVLEVTPFDGVWTQDERPFALEQVTAVRDLIPRLRANLEEERAREV